VPAPFTRRAAGKIRPEAGAQTGDHPGFGTLLFTLEADAPAGPGDSPPAATVGRAHHSAKLPSE